MSGDFPTLRKISVPYNGPAVDDATVQKTFNQHFSEAWKKMFEYHAYETQQIVSGWERKHPLRWNATLRIVTDEGDRATHSVG